MSDLRWVELAVEVDHEAVESVSEVFSHFGYQGGVAIQQPIFQDGDGDNLRVDTTRTFTITTYVPLTQFSEDVRFRVEQQLWHLNQIRPVGALAVTVQSESDWEHAWKAHFKPVRICDRFVIRPPWMPYPADPDDIVIVLDPGMAFGTGTHPTTRLGLQLMQLHPVRDRTVLDVGTGTGILAIAAALQGAGLVDAIEIDGVGMRQARSNVALNGVQSVVRVHHADGACGYPRDGYDLIVANIISRILVELNEGLISSVHPGGSLVLSGIIETKEADVLDAFAGRGLDLLERIQEDDWVALRFVSQQSQ